tara:strand:- start:6131 stop:6325 length:195 start_codon:yes stop_codon:yes gene_type:complete
MTLGEIIKKLVLSENYLIARSNVSDEIISFIETTLPHDYGLIKEKEYQRIISVLKKSLDVNNKI